MASVYASVEAHYHQSGLLEAIFEKLKEKGVAPTKATRQDLSAVDEFHVRGAAVSQELAQSIPLKDKKVLDVGCGIGGPCRMLAAEYGCHATGLDLSHEYVRTATGLSKLVHLQDHTSFVQGNATKLPFKDASFDVVWTQHAQMNIGEKEKFYSEIYRVLVPGGSLLYYDIFQGPNGTVTFPVPWASREELSFLCTVEQMQQILEDLGMEQTASKDQTPEGIAFFQQLLERIQKNGPPILGLNVLMGSTTKTKIVNLLNGLKEGQILLWSGAYTKR